MEQYTIDIPGRVNISGAHIDYFGGKVIASATKKLRMTAEITGSEDKEVKEVAVYSENTNQRQTFSNTSSKHSVKWVQYLQGAKWAYEEFAGKEEVKGFEMEIESNIPMGGGLASSSALTIAGVTAFCLVNGFPGSGSEEDTDKIVEWIENGDSRADVHLESIALMAAQGEWWYGTTGGIMDQMTIALANEGEATCVDCKEEEVSYLDFPEEWKIVVTDSNTSHDQKKSEFAKRVEEASSGLSKLPAKTFPELSLPVLNEHARDLKSGEYDRCRHAVNEMNRVEENINFLREGNKKEFLHNINRTYESLRDLYKTTNHVLDKIYKMASKTNGFLAARPTGAGWGGCIISIVEADKADNFRSQMEAKYTNGESMVLAQGQGLNIK